MNDWAIDTTLKAGWKECSFHHFLKNANQKEYLTSQIPFFYAVEAFPRMLCKLAMSIQTSEERLLVIQNLWEEHGQGENFLFHTQTYKTYLDSLGWDKTLFTNPWVQEWINKVLNLENNPIYLASYLSGIEYLYAQICQDITQHLNNFELLCVQSHYAKHSVLDWEHGHELLEVAINISNNESNTVNDNVVIIKDAFKEAQKDFLYMYSHLAIPTQKQAHEIHEEKIAFYYIREDSKIEAQVIKQIKKDKKNDGVIDILSICSGGEHIFEYLSHNAKMNIEVIDINPNQLNLAQEKLNILLSDLSNKNHHPILTEQHVGKFEKMFALLRSYFNSEELNEFIVGQQTDKLKFITDVLFSNDYLNIIFGEDATKYTVLNFAQHFYSLFLHRLSKKEENTMNVFFATAVRNYEALAQQVQTGYPLSQLSWAVANPKNTDFHGMYDMINLSNIGDWMSFNDYQNMIINFQKCLKPNGAIIARKLLGDYELKATFEKMGFNCIIKQDDTYFYTECVVAYQK
jgi:hypothetical protein